MLIVKSYGKLPVESQTNVPRLRISLDRCQEICLNTFWGGGGGKIHFSTLILLTVIKRYLIVPQAEAVFYVPHTSLFLWNPGNVPLYESAQNLPLLFIHC